MEQSAVGNSAVIRVARNAASILGSNILVRATTFVIYALMARHTGVREFGQFSLALTLLYTFHIFAVAGLKTLTVREVAKDHSQAYMHLYNASVLVLITSTLSLIGIVFLTRALGYSADTKNIIFAVFIGLLPYALSQICESIFQAWEKMHYIAYANGPMHLLKAIAAYLLLINAFDVIYVAYAVAAAYWGILLIEWFVLISMKPKTKVRIDFRFMSTLARRAVTFLGIEGVYAINTSIGVLVLSKMLSEEAVGIYSSAMQVTVPLGIIINDLVHSVFPIMCRKYDEGMVGLSWVVERLLEVLIVLVLPAIVGISLLADQVLMLLYNNPEFLSATFVLRILVWWSLANAIITVLGQVLWASDREKKSLIIAVTAVSVNLLGSLIFVYFFGLAGVVVTAIIVAIVTLIQHYLPVSELISTTKFIPIFWKPIVGVTGMTIALLMANNNPLFISITIGAVVYTLIIAILYLWSYGGLNEMKIHLLNPST